MANCVSHQGPGVHGMQDAGAIDVAGIDWAYHDPDTLRQTISRLAFTDPGELDVIVDALIQHLKSTDPTADAPSGGTAGLDEQDKCSLLCGQFVPPPPHSTRHTFTAHHAVLLSPGKRMLQPSCSSDHNIPFARSLVHHLFLHESRMQGWSMPPISCWPRRTGWTA